MMTDPLAEDSGLMGERLWSRGTDHIDCELPERRLEPPRELDLRRTDEPHQ
ncbi:hypothetical protein [Garicola koreensis]|uniref:Uncharacterized protein n=1 Tax=Garicola koreensis TaxID=1262554 RepID=A0A7W5XNR4_9MICC|nr:hypothetical protein [Garicola koreensis]MBB3667027.1 hypothetical protein [Garicola koreensis]